MAATRPSHAPTSSTERRFPTLFHPWRCQSGSHQKLSDMTAGRRLAGSTWQANDMHKSLPQGWETVP